MQFCNGDKTSSGLLLKGYGDKETAENTEHILKSFSSKMWDEIHW